MYIYSLSDYIKKNTIIQLNCGLGGGWWKSAKGIGHPRVKDPSVTISGVSDLKELPRVVISSLSRFNHLKTRPRDSSGGVGTRTSVVELVVGAGLFEGASHPGHVPFGEEDVIDLGVHDHHLRVNPPGPAEVRDLGGHGRELGLAGEDAVLEDQGAGAVDLGPSAGGDHALLGLHGLPHDELAVLEKGNGIAEDKVDGAGDGAVAVELALGLCIESVLVTVHVTVVEDGLVSCYPQSHCLVLLCSCGVLESNVLRDEVSSVHTCHNSPLLVHSFQLHACTCNIIV